MPQKGGQTLCTRAARATTGCVRKGVRSCGGAKQTCQRVICSPLRQAASTPMRVDGRGGHCGGDWGLCKSEAVARVACRHCWAGPICSAGRSSR
jgi:hypothetical protein